jgi:D-alanyl-D-alanine dipeptidase
LKNYQGIVAQLVDKPIKFVYSQPTDEEVASIQSENGVVILDDLESKQLVLGQNYYRMKLNGSTEQTFTRTAIAHRLKTAVEMLSSHCGIMIFDAFRSLTCQKSLFHHVSTEVSAKNPGFSPEEVFKETCKFVVNPDTLSQFAIPPHNSGGAIDLGLQKDGVLLDFGSRFDDPSIVSSTAFFEGKFKPEFGFSEKRWELVRSNRRILFHTMIALGFTNYEDEWWHYDLGDCMWSKALKLPQIYDSMELEVRKKCEAYTV